MVRCQRRCPTRGSPEEAARLQRQAGLASPEAIAIGAYLIRGRGHTVLVDTGTGGANGVGGALIANLALLGVRPEEIDTILLTHAHPDHIGGLLTAAASVSQRHGVPASRESAYWLAPSTLDNASDRGRRNVLLVRRVLAICATQIRDIDEEEPVAGIRPCPLPGHTPGHTGYRLEAGDTSLLIWGDIVHFPPFRPPGQRCRSPSTSILNRPGKPGKSAAPGRQRTVADRRYASWPAGFRQRGEHRLRLLSAPV
jgi:glyoxylase-like metal-dependent hydrolase (beta-lactamase superfamily II)